jgi:hypothetical protein
VLTRRRILQLGAAAPLAPAAPSAHAPTGGIARIEVFPVAYAVTAHFKFLPKPERPAVFVKITAEGGAYGWGQSVPIPTWSYETVESVTTALENYIAPALLGREFFRSKVTSYRMHNFEDVVIFVHDVERCLDGLDTFSRSLIARIALQEHTQMEAARILGCTQRTIERRYPEALDALSYLLLQKNLLETTDRGGRRRHQPVDAGLPPRKPMARVFACQEGKNAEISLSCSPVKK